MFGQFLDRARKHIAFPAGRFANRDKRKRIGVFILSSAHSGSTWTGYVLGSGPDSAFLGEYHRGWDEALRVPCTLCASRGLPTCEVLYDIEKEPAARALDLAFARTRKRIVVDTSKRIEWIKLFRGGGEAFDIRIVHLIRDPRGFFASIKRRMYAGLDAAMAQWCRENEEFREFIAGSGLPSVLVSYDSLARSPQAEFRRLFEFCGTRYTEDSLSYWNFGHHGFAANGASDAVLRRIGFGNVPGHFATGDAAFYERNSGTRFHDLRWRAALTPAESAAIESNVQVQNALNKLGFALTREGIVPSPGFVKARQTVTTELR